MTQSEYSRQLREAAAKRAQRKRELAVKFSPISDEIAAFYDSRRLTEEDVDHMAELHSEGRTYNRNASLRSSHE
jgi:hypothetical protein